MSSLRTECVCPAVLQQSPSAHTHRDEAAGVLPLLGHKAVHVCSQLILWETHKPGQHIYSPPIIHTHDYYVCFACKFELRSSNASAQLQVSFKENGFKILTLVYPAKQLPPSVKNILPFSPVIYSTQRQVLIKMVSVLSAQWSICCWEVKMNVNCSELWQVLGWPSFSFLQVPPTALLLPGLEHPDTLNVHSWPGHSWLRLKLKIMSNSQLSNSLDGVSSSLN